VAAVPIYGRYDWFSREGSGRPEFIGILQRFIVKKRFAENRQDFLDASPIAKVRPDAPPFFVLHGEDDSIIPVGEGREFVAALSEKSDEVVVYSEIPHAQHAFDFFGSPHGHFTATAVAHFLDWVKAKRG
jgi:acetyl esterase/lipase